MERPYTRKRSLVANVALLVIFLNDASTQATAPRTLLDLSYFHNLDASTLVEAIQSHLPEDGEKQKMSDGGYSSILEVDVSSSALGDRGLKEILDVLLPTDVDKKSNTELSLHFTAQMNSITPVGAAALIQRVLGGTNATGSEEQRPLLVQRQRVTSLDLGWNNLQAEVRGSKSFHKALQQLFESSDHCPDVVRLDNCGLGPAACRAIGKGLINRYKDKKLSETSRRLSLHLCGNHAVGDAGAAALAAAIRTVAGSESGEGIVVLDKLDLSACDIGDAGAEALALALESSPTCCIRHLDMSSNRITDQGALALGQALSSPDTIPVGKDPRLHSLDLSGNKDIGDRGAAAIAAVVEKANVPSVALRSCHIHADGASSFGKALRALVLTKDVSISSVSVDLSGNPIGVLRGKSKKDGGKYSASRLKSKASATAASYMNQGLSFLKKGLKDTVGVDVSPVLGASAESDDEEDSIAGGNGDLETNDGTHPSNARCGAKAMASAFTGFVEPDDRETGKAQSGPLRSIHLGLRHCFLDHAGADALAAMLVAAKDEMDVDLKLDVHLNPILEDSMVDALHGDMEQEDRLREMAERHTEAMLIILESRQRAAEAADAAAARAAAEAEFEAASWGSPAGFDMEPSEEEWDSDADYDDEDEDAY